MSLNEYLIRVGESLATGPRWRLGQTYFNVLAEVRPDLAERVRGSELDPYYLNERGTLFLDWLAENWGEG